MTAEMYALGGYSGAQSQGFLLPGLVNYPDLLLCGALVGVGSQDFCESSMPSLGLVPE